MQKIYPSSLSYPKGHYSPAIVHQQTVYVAGQLPIDENGVPQLGSIEAQTELCLQNLETILLAAGSDRDHVLKVGIFVSDISTWPKVNEVYARFFGEHRPARMVIPCNTLNYGCGIELDCVAAVAETSVGA
jgi:2-iminobutanoate/2-iminopropanoate deaminase